MMTRWIIYSSAALVALGGAAVLLWGPVRSGPLTAALGPHVVEVVDGPIEFVDLKIIGPGDTVIPGPDGWNVHSFSFNTSVPAVLMCLRSSVPLARDRENSYALSTRDTVAYASAGRGWHRLAEAMQSDPYRLAFAIPPLFPPGADVRFRLDHQGTRSEWVIHGLHVSKRADWARQPTLDTVRTGAATIEGRAFTALVKGGGYPGYAAALRVVPAPSDRHVWFFDNLAVSASIEPMYGWKFWASVGYELSRPDRMMAPVEYRPFADQVDRVKVSGKLIGYDASEQAVDFGWVPVRQTARGMLVSPLRPIVRTAFGRPAVLLPLTSAVLPDYARKGDVWARVHAAPEKGKKLDVKVADEQGRSGLTDDPSTIRIHEGLDVVDGQVRLRAVFRRRVQTVQTEFRLILDCQGQIEDPTMHRRPFFGSSAILPNPQVRALFGPPPAGAARAVSWGAGSQ